MCPPPVEVVLQDLERKTEFGTISSKLSVGMSLEGLNPSWVFEEIRKRRDQAFKATSIFDPSIYVDSYYNCEAKCNSHGIVQSCKETLAELGLEIKLFQTHSYVVQEKLKGTMGTMMGKPLIV